MRDPARIPRILAALEAHWRANPDLRLAQIVCNVHRFHEGGDPAPASLYGMEDDAIECALTAPPAAEPAHEWTRLADERPPVGSLVYIRGDDDFREDVPREVVEPDDAGGCVYPTWVLALAGDDVFSNLQRRGDGLGFPVSNTAEWRPAHDTHAAPCVRP